MKTGDDGRKDNAYWSREIAANLGIANSTLRKWCRELEAQGYRFARDEHQRRAFTEHDAVVMRYVKELAHDRGVSLESAAKAVIERFGHDALRSVAHSDTEVSERYGSAMQRLEKHIEQQENFNKELLRQLDEQRRFIEESLQRRDDQLIATMREMLETRKQLAAAEQRRWWKFWNRSVH